jgi:hypothetical protein
MGLIRFLRDIIDSIAHVPNVPKPKWVCPVCGGKDFHSSEADDNHFSVPYGCTRTIKTCNNCGNAETC